MNYEPQTELDRIEAIKTVFEADGWSLFLEDIKQNCDSIDTVAGLDDLLSLGIRQGQLNTLNGILNYENLIVATEEQINSDIEAAKAEDSPDA